MTTCARCQQASDIHARGICVPCHKAATANGTLDNYPRVTRTITEVAAEYELLVRRWPTMTNRELAAHVGMTRDAFTQAITRARRAGLVTLRRRAYGHLIEIAPPGDASGYAGGYLPRHRQVAA